MGIEKNVNDFFSSRAGSYLRASRTGIWARFREKEWRTVAELLKPSAGASIVDLGCGAGYYSLRLARELGARPTGVDSSKEMLAVLEKEGFPTVHASIESPGPIGAFDHALIAGALEFVSSPERAIRSSGELVRDGGRLVILVPTAGVIGLAYKLAHELHGCPTRIRTEAAYRMMAESAGFSWTKTVSCTCLSFAMSFEKIRRHERTD